MKFLKLTIQFDSGAKMEAKGTDIVPVLPLDILKAMKEHIDQTIKEREKKEVSKMAKAASKGRSPAVLPKPKKKVVKK